MESLETTGYEYVDGVQLSTPLSGETTVLAASHGITPRPVVCTTRVYCGPGVKSPVTVECNDTTVPECYLTPQSCLDGFTCNEGSETPKGTAECLEGYFCPGRDCGEYFVENGINYTYPAEVVAAEQANLARTICPCPPGHSCPGTGRTFPKSCVPGFYSDTVTLRVCHVCPLGHTCPNIAQVTPQPPQFSSSLSGLMQAPPQQLWPAPQVTPQPPQLRASVSRSVQRPAPAQ